MEIEILIRKPFVSAWLNSAEGIIRKSGSGKSNSKFVAWIEEYENSFTSLKHWNRWSTNVFQWN